MEVPIKLAGISEIKGAVRKHRRGWMRCRCPNSNINLFTYKYYPESASKVLYDESPIKPILSQLNEDFL